MDIICDEIQKSRLQTLLTEIAPIMSAKKGDLLYNYVNLCGTPMCIAGEACILPQFNLQGLKFYDSSDNGRCYPTYLNHTGVKALDIFFGNGAYEALFSPNHTDYTLDVYVIKQRFSDLKEFLK